MIRRMLTLALDVLFPLPAEDPDLDERGAGQAARNWDAERAPATIEQRHADLRAVLATIAAGKPAMALAPVAAQHHLELVQRCAQLAVVDDEREAVRARR